VQGQGKGKAAQVIRTERLGDQTRLHLRLDGHDIITLTDVHTVLEAGDEVRLQPHNPLYFDVNGIRLA
jgi:multiple sugar transport system ATP-binding protein